MMRQASAMVDRFPPTSGPSLVPIIIDRFFGKIPTRMNSHSIVITETVPTGGWMCNWLIGSWMGQMETKGDVAASDCKLQDIATVLQFLAFCRSTHPGCR
jgi:hypothetical protein